jgi:hypothetical protein
MKPARQGRRPGPGVPAASESTSGGWLQKLAEGLLAAVIVCRLLTPTDGAPAGETVWIAQLALLALIVWVLAAYRGGELRLGFDWIDAAGMLFCLGHMAGAMLIIAGQGDRRAALNMLWEWCGVAATFILMRSLIESGSRRMALLLVVLATAVALSGLGLWQTYGGYAEARREYQQAKSEMESLERAGRPADARAAAEWERALSRSRARMITMGAPADENTRILFELRLQSSEPIAMFALANTLGGLLTCAALLWMGLLFVSVGSAPRWQLAVAVVFMLLLLYCLILTKSRTAAVGLVSGLAVWAAGGALRGAADRRRWGRILAGGTVVVAGLIAAATATGKLDRRVVFESTKSLRYRFEYWQATWQMLTSSPRQALLGVGAGNFRQHYLPFKLAQSSEEVADPHNMVLDVWANGGIVALAGLAGICAAGLWPLWHAGRAAASDDAGGPGWRDPFLVGGVVGFLAVFAAGGALDERVVMLWCGWLAVVAACRSLFRREFSAVVYAAAFAALAVHLLGAGGIGMPGISQLLLLLAVFGTSAAALPCKVVALRSRWSIAAAGAASLGLYLGCWITGLMPVMNARFRLDAADYEFYNRQNAVAAEREMLLAAQADPWSPEPYRRLAQLAFLTSQAGVGKRAEAFDRSIGWQRSAIARDPQNSPVYRQLGETYLARFAVTEDKADALAAAEAFGQAVALYPNQSRSRAGLAEALWKAGARDAAQAPARLALELDAINEKAGHRDKRLLESTRNLLKQIVEEP